MFWVVLEATYKILGLNLAYTDIMHSRKQRVSAEKKMK